MGWMTYVLLGEKGEAHANCLMPKRGCKRELARHPDLELKKEFKAPSFNVARVVYEDFNGKNGHFHDQTVDEFIRQVADYYGYSIVKNDKV